MGIFKLFLICFFGGNRKILISFILGISLIASVVISIFLKSFFPFIIVFIPIVIILGIVFLISWAVSKRQQNNKIKIKKDETEIFKAWLEEELKKK